MNSNGTIANRLMMSRKSFPAADRDLRLVAVNERVPQSSHASTRTSRSSSPGGIPGTRPALRLVPSQSSARRYAKRHSRRTRFQVRVLECAYVVATLGAAAVIWWSVL